MNRNYHLMALAMTAGLMSTSLASAGGCGRDYGYMTPPPPPPHMRAPFAFPHAYGGPRPMMPHYGVYGGRYTGAPTDRAGVPSQVEAKSETAAESSPPTVALPQSGDVTLGSIGAGDVLADSRGMTLYTFTQDRPGLSNCSGSCADSWPPVIAASDAQANGDFSLVERGDGTVQWAYQNRPLYTWVGDRKPGDATGDGVGGVWRAVRL